jgi:mycobactin peptide synthetase MbtE
VDIVPLRVSLSGHRTFADLVTACGEEMAAALANPAAALEDIVGGLGVPRDPSRHPLVQTLFNVFNFASPRLELAGLTVVPQTAGLPGSPFDLTAYLLESDGDYTVELVYNPDLFDDSRMEALLAAYLSVLVSPDEPSVTPWLLEGVAQPSIPAQRARGKREQASTATEECVRAIWMELLGHSDFGVTDNFFDVGGSSMMMVPLQSRVAAVLHREVTVVELFSLPTVRALAASVDQSSNPGQEDGIDRALARARARATAGRRRDVTGGQDT